MGALLTAALAEVVLVSYRSVRRGLSVPAAAPLPAPLPAEYSAVVLVYGTLMILPDSLAPIPALVGWGLVVATVLNLWTPGAPAAPPAPVAPIVKLPQPAGVHFSS